MELHQTEVLERSIRIAARPETVFSFFTDPKKMTLWKGVSATLDPRPGGIYRVDINGRDIARGEYVEVVPYSRIVFTWGWEGEGSMVPPGSTTVEVTLAPDGDGTLVTLKHFGLSDEHRAVHDEGWGLFLLRLDAASQGRDPGPMPMSEGHEH
ncbi:MAG: SRPBCC domain-containing protein [Chloroflexi bacterium]|nr:SRPBCC domain-containing protein [Chloroflexota bacterium]